MSHVILGLLLLRPMSFYDLVKAFEAGVSLFYSSSSGSIKRALDKLVDEGLVEVTAIDSGGRARRTHEVTPAGRSHFREWMLEPPSGDLETGSLARLYFLGLMTAEERTRIVTHIHERIEAERAKLATIEREITNVEVPASLEDVARFQRATLRFGLDSHRFAATWFAQLQHELIE